MHNRISLLFLILMHKIKTNGSYEVTSCSSNVAYTPTFSLYPVDSGLRLYEYIFTNINLSNVSIFKVRGEAYYNAQHFKDFSKNN